MQDKCMTSSSSSTSTSTTTASFSSSSDDSPPPSSEHHQQQRSMSELNQTENSTLATSNSTESTRMASSTNKDDSAESSSGEQTGSASTTTATNSSEQSSLENTITVTTNGTTATASWLTKNGNEPKDSNQQGKQDNNNNTDSSEESFNNQNGLTSTAAKTIDPLYISQQNNGKSIDIVNGDGNERLQHSFRQQQQHQPQLPQADQLDDSYNKLPHWSHNVTFYEFVSIGDCLISGGSDYGQLAYFSDTGDIILEIDDIQVSGLTSGDIEEILSRNLTHSFRLVPTASGLPLELREYLSRRFARGSVDHSLQEVIRENVYQRTIPCTTRPAKGGEVDEVDYKFLSVDQFGQMERAGLLLESGIYQGYHYGTPLPVSNLSSTSKSNNVANTNGGTVDTNGNGSSSSALNSPTSPTIPLTSSQLSLAAKRKRNRSNLAAIDGATLPYGWERISDAHYGVYYIDHINKRTQYERPYECELVKGVSGFGFTLIEIDKGLVVVKSLIQGGAAQASGVIASGDVLVSVAGVSVAGLQHSDIAHLFSTFNTGDRVKLTFARGYQLPLGINDEDYDIITLKIIKGVQGFGFTISEGHNGQKVKKILDLERCCALRQGDILLSINGIDLTTLSHLEVVETLKQCQIDDTTEFMIKRKKNRFGSSTKSKSPTQMDIATETGSVLQAMDTNVMSAYGSFKGARVSANGVPSQEVIYQQFPIKMNGNGNYAEYMMDDGMVMVNGYANGQQQQHPQPPEYANSQYAMAHYEPINGSHYGSMAQYQDYQYQTPLSIKSQSAPLLKPSNLDSPSNEVLFGANNSIDPIDYEYIQVTLNRNENGFGFRIIGGSEEGSNVAIGSIVIGGAAYKDGVLKAGDEIVSINENNVMGASHQEVVQLMSQTGMAVRILVRRKRYLNAYDVTLYRQDYEGFGFVIISCGNCALIGRIIEGSPAHRCQRLHIRDRIIAVNGADVTGLSHPEIVNKIKESGETLHLRIIPGDCYSVELIRGPSGYGFSIRGGAEYNGMPLFILAIAPNGPAATLLTVGDEILEINDCATAGLTHADAVRLISQSGPAVKLRLRRNVTGSVNDLFNGSGPLSPGRVATPTQMAPPPPPSLIPSQLSPGSVMSPSPNHLVPSNSFNGGPPGQPSPNLTNVKYVSNMMNY